MSDLSKTCLIRPDASRFAVLLFHFACWLNLLLGRVSLRLARGVERLEIHLALKPGTRVVLNDKCCTITRGRPPGMIVVVDKYDVDAMDYMCHAESDDAKRGYFCSRGVERILP